MSVTAGLTTVTVVTRTLSGTNQYGQPTYLETSTDYPNVLFWPEGTPSENTTGGDELTLPASVVLPHGSVVSALDVVVVGGTRWEVDGEPADFVHPVSGWTPGVLVKLKRVEG